ncbi:MAG TPA: WD40 repeat domain-containing protein, partial [Armatimonadota bacterium]|nr:WD40 repeat domain-containing protein [Armatimonadota bacterium]
MDSRVSRRLVLSLCLPLGLLLSRSALPAPAPVWSVAFSPDGAQLAAGSYQKIQLWDVATRMPV